MRTLASTPMSSELQLELGLELELNSDDVAAAEAAVAAHIGDQLTCSCCDQILTDRESLHLHQISQHSISELSLALLSLRGLDLKSVLDISAPQDSDSVSTVSANSFMCGLLDDYPNSITQDQPTLNALSSNLKFSETNDNYATSSITPQFSSDMVKTIYSGVKKLEPIHLESFLTEKDGDGLGVSQSLYSDEKAVMKPLYAISNECSQLSVECNRDVNGRFQKVSPICEEKEFLNEASNPRSTPIAAGAQKRQNKTQNNSRKGVKQGASKGQSSTKEGSNDVIDLTQDSKTPAAKSKKYATKRAASKKDSEERKFACDVCGRTYKKKSHLGRHVRLHSGARPFPCTVCDKRFAVRSILKQHLRVHTGERPFKCLFCDQRFPQKSGLVTHMMLHTGKPYKCDSCNKSFVSNHKLAVHKRAHEEQNGRLPFQGPFCCSACSTRFFTTSALLEHGKVHSSPAEPATLTEGSSDSILPGLSQLRTLLTKENDSPRNDDDCNEKTELEKLLGNIPFRTKCGPKNFDAKSYPIDLRTDLNANKHNSQEVTAGKALLTLMDSNDDPQAENEEMINSDYDDSGSNKNPDDVLSDFEFCDVDLKSSIDLKEECFDF